MLNSMTAFARKKALDELGMVWELRTVNHRYLEINVRLPERLRCLETRVREQLRQQLSRGKVDCNLYCGTDEVTQPALAINQPLLLQLNKFCQDISDVLVNPAPINPLDLLRWPGVLQAHEPALADTEALLMAALEQAVVELQQMRAAEGRQLEGFIQQRLAAIDVQLQQLKHQLPALLSQQRERLLARVADLPTTVDPDRIEQEILLLVQKTDVSEEVDRITVHLAHVRQALAYEGSIGRKLDFLMQELNREANTIGAKSNSTYVTSVSIELKVLIEQMREQVQNVE